MAMLSAPIRPAKRFFTWAPASPVTFTSPVPIASTLNFAVLPMVTLRT